MKNCKETIIPMSTNCYLDLDEKCIVVIFCKKLIIVGGHMICKPFTYLPWVVEIIICRKHVVTKSFPSSHSYAFTFGSSTIDFQIHYTCLMSPRFSTLDIW